MTGQFGLQRRAKTAAPGAGRLLLVFCAEDAIKKTRRIGSRINPGAGLNF
jgi:hypothetical protein